MKDNAPFWCVTGMIVGVASVLIALRVVPVAPPAQPIPQINTELEAAELLMLKSINKFINNMAGQFTSAADDAQDSRLASDLQAVRAQMELFKCEHGYYPGDDSPDKDGSSYDSDQFVTDLTYTTTGIGESSCGPYLQEFPSNPFVDPEVASLVQTNSPASPDPEKFGWVYNGDTCKFSPTASEPSE